MKETHTNIADRIYNFGDFELDVKGRRFTENGNLVKLTRKSFDLLQLLLEKNGEIVSREEILKQIWNDEFVEDSNINVQIANLRRVLGPHKNIIQTVSKRGYCFTEKVSIKMVGPAGGTRSPAGFARTFLNSLVVLPLVNADQNPQSDYLAAGLTENLIGLLSGLPRLKVIAYPTVSWFKGKEYVVSKVGRMLDVETALTGSVRQLNRTIWFDLKLVRVADDVVLWSLNRQAPSPEILLQQSEIAVKVAETLLGGLTEPESRALAITPTAEPEAYHDYLRAGHQLATHTKAGLEKSLDYFNRAIAADPDYALAYVGIANALFLLNGYSFSPLESILAKTRQAISRAHEIAPDLAEVRATRGALKYVYEWNWYEAEKEFLLAVKFNPNYTFARYWYVVFLMLSGRFTEAREHLNHLAVIDPLSLSLHKTTASLLYYQRRYEESIQQAEKTLELYPKSIRLYPALAISYSKLGQFEKSIALMTAGYEAAPSLSRLAVLGYLHAAAGETIQARQIRDHINRESKTPQVENFFIFVELGEIEEGLDYLEKSLVRKDLEHVALIVEPRADKVRSNSRFIEIMSKIH
ncbi:MAG: winged helix-turn-helix domain-containing protein [Acidobacteria bacterium]|nr:winged helix-turn-helix domain-containing protein [Acidobacteriota bacterium]